MSAETVVPLPPRVKNITGQKFGRLTAIRFVDRKIYPSGKRRALWEFQCECGNTTIAPMSAVKFGNTKSCGCFQREVRRTANTTHGDGRREDHSRIYQTWNRIIQRCCDPKHPDFPYYGGRGIKLLWADYETFRVDMLSTYAPGLCIERIDNNGHYCKENCRWATRTEQTRNRRNTVRLTFNGKTLALAQWAEETGLSYGALKHRLYDGWPTDRILTTPLQVRSGQGRSGVGSSRQ